MQERCFDEHEVIAEFCKFSDVSVPSTLLHETTGNLNQTPSQSSTQFFWQDVNFERRLLQIFYKANKSRAV